MSLTTEPEELVNEKAKLIQILQSLDEEQKYLRKRFRIVEEKLAIQELEEKIKAKRAVVEQLKSKIRELEEKLKEPQKKEPMEVMAKVAPRDSQQPKQPETAPRAKVW